MRGDEKTVDEKLGMGKQVRTGTEGVVIRVVRVNKGPTVSAGCRR